MKISKATRDYIAQELHRKGEMTIKEVVDIIRPECNFDIEGLIEEQLEKIADAIIQNNELQARHIELVP